MAWMVQTSGGVILNVHAVPRAARNAIQGLHGEAVKIRLQAPPVEGKANRALLRCLSEALDVPERQLTLLSGAAGRRKRVLIAGLSRPEIQARLNL